MKKKRHVKSEQRAKKKNHIFLETIPEQTVMSLQSEEHSTAETFDLKKLNGLYDTAKGVHAYMTLHYPDEGYSTIPEIKCARSIPKGFAHLFETDATIKWTLTMPLPNILTEEQFETIKNNVQNRVKNRLIESITYDTLPAYQSIQGICMVKDTVERENLIDGMKQFATQEKRETEAIQAEIYQEDIRKLKETSEVMLQIPLKN